MSAALRKTYHSDSAGRFALATKRKITQIMHYHGVTIAELSRQTGIPDRTLKRWLDEDEKQAPTLPGLSMIADHFGVTVRDLLPDPRIRHVDDERYQALAPFYSLPITHIQWLYDHYRRAVALLKYPD